MWHSYCWTWNEWPCTRDRTCRLILWGDYTSDQVWEICCPKHSVDIQHQITAPGHLILSLSSTPRSWFPIFFLFFLYLGSAYSYEKPQFPINYILKPSFTLAGNHWPLRSHNVTKSFLYKEKKKKKILSAFTPSHIIPNLYGFLSSVEHKRRHFEGCC